jgi:AbrB family looped-hinge helix DNA binding protein
MRFAKVKLDAAGRILIPAELRKALDMRVGEYMALDLEREHCEIRVYTMRENTRRIHERMRPYWREGVSMVDELIAERRAEAARE